MQIAEIFYSIQGEGKLMGIPSSFIRTSGCNLRCVWCDTPYTSWEPQGEEIDVQKIVERVKSYPTRYAVLTGGEPMIQSEVTELTRSLRDAGLHITIETAATVYRDVVCDLASLSPKLSNSTPHQRAGGRHAAGHDRDRINVEVIQRFMNEFDHQLKFVVDRPPDVDEIDTLLERLSGVEADDVLLMPQGTEPAELSEKGSWVAELCKERGFRFCPRLHIMLYGNVRRT
ncbi:MAG: 7-carboxy-7-deazaguanine synthase QueE [Planctomycetes bacterium]|nr:7-carboxy-7-deazaguanine synthase QueE [Planctomycetota bacterium]